MPSSNIYIANLAIADLIFLFHGPIKLHQLSRSEFKLGAVICHSNHGIKTLFMLESVFLISMLAFDRYQSINHIVSNELGWLVNSCLVRTKTIQESLLCFDLVNVRSSCITTVFLHRGIAQKKLYCICKGRVLPGIFSTSFGNSRKDIFSFDLQKTWKVIITYKL